MIKEVISDWLGWVRSSRGVGSGNIVRASPKAPRGLQGALVPRSSLTPRGVDGTAAVAGGKGFNLGCDLAVPRSPSGCS
jgi:hypothetical protein